MKTRHRRLDQLDLLVKLRDLLVANLEVRGEFQRLFDHVFVDEFQDTDPLQAEIILLPVRARARRRRWDQVVLRPGALTLVGDPKQSIYRFRRADVAMYDRVRQVVAAQDALSRHALRQLPQRAVADRLAQRPLRRDPRPSIRRRAVRSRDGARLPAAPRGRVARAAPRPPCTCCPCQFPDGAQAQRGGVPGSRGTGARALSALAGHGERGHRSSIRSTGGREPVTVR